MNWSFGIVNNKLAEIYFEKKKGKINFLGHCYIKKNDFTSSKEKKWISEDIKKVKLIYIVPSKPNVKFCS